MQSKYSIKDLEHLSGVKAHTLRIWEQRYNLITPKRTPTNIRYYSDEDLKRILNVSVLVHSGMRIGKVSALSDEAIREKILEKTKRKGELSGHLNGLKMAMVNFDTTLFHQILSDSVNQLGYHKTFTDLIGCFIQEVGLLWQTSVISVANEHFISNLIRQKLCVAVDELPQPKPKAKNVLLFLPSQELHEIGLLYLNYVALKKGYNVIYMGQSIPIEDLKSVLEKKSFDFAVSIFTSHPVKEKLEEYLSELRNTLGNLPLHACGLQLQDISQTFSKTKFYRDVKHLESHI